MEEPSLPNLWPIIEEISIEKRRRNSNFLSTISAVGHCLSYQGWTRLAKNSYELEEQCKAYHFHSPLEITKEILGELKSASTPSQLSTNLAQVPLKALPVQDFSDFESSIASEEAVWNIQAVVFQKFNYYISALRSEEEWTVLYLSGKCIYPSWKMLCLDSNKLGLQPILTFYKKEMNPLERFETPREFSKNIIPSEDQDIISIIRNRNNLGFKPQIQPSDNPRIPINQIPQEPPSLHTNKLIDSEDPSIKSPQDSIKLESSRQSSQEISSHGNSQKKPIPSPEAIDDNDDSNDSENSLDDIIPKLDFSNSENAINKRKIQIEKLATNEKEKPTSLTKPPPMLSKIEKNKTNASGKPLFPNMQNSTKIDKIQSKISVTDILPDRGRASSSDSSESDESSEDNMFNEKPIKKLASSNLANISQRDESSKGSKLDKNTQESSSNNAKLSSAKLPDLLYRGDSSKGDMFTKNSHESPSMLGKSPFTNLPNLSARQNTHEIGQPIKHPQHSDSSSYIISSNSNKLSAGSENSIPKPQVSSNNNKKLSKPEISSESDSSSDSIDKNTKDSKMISNKFSKIPVNLNPLIPNKNKNIDSSSSSSDKNQPKNVKSIDPSIGKESIENERVSEKNIVYKPPDISEESSSDSDLSDIGGILRFNNPAKKRTAMEKSSDSRDSERKDKSSSFPISAPSDSQSFSDIPQNWICNHCNNLNTTPDHCSKCKISLTKNLGDLPTKIDQNAEESISFIASKSIKSMKNSLDTSKGLNWVCTHCSFPNESDRYICRKCEKSDSKQYKRMTGQEIKRL